MSAALSLESAAREPGDGRVCLHNALLPDAVPSTFVEVDAEHSQLLNGSAVIKLPRIAP